MMKLLTRLKSHANRRSFFKRVLAVSTTTVGAGLLGKRSSLFGQQRHGDAKTTKDDGKITKGDAAILRFLAAAEILESDLWIQYNELGGVQDNEVPGLTGGSGSAPYIAALQVLDGDMPQYIHDNTEDELSHFQFINAWLRRARRQSTSISSALYRAVPRLGHGKSAD